MLTDLIGYFAGICLALSFLPQVIKTVQTKSADDVSMGMLLLSFAAAAGYEVYAWRLGLLPVVVMNGVFLALVATELVLKILFSRKPASVGEMSARP